MVTFRQAKSQTLTALQTAAATIVVDPDAIVYAGGSPPSITPYVEIQALPAATEDIAIDGAINRRMGILMVSACPNPNSNLNDAQNECIELLERIEDVLDENIPWLEPQYNLYDGIEEDSGHYRATLQYSFDYLSSTEVE